MRFKKDYPWDKRIRDFAADHVALYLRRPRAEKKSLARQLHDVYRLYRCYGAVPHHYLTHELYRRDCEADVCDFVPPAYLRRLNLWVNPKEATRNVENKKRFAKLMHAAGVPAVPLLASVSVGASFLDAEDVAVSFDELLLRLRRSGHERIFVKPTFGANGAGVFAATVGQHVLRIDGREEDEAAFRARLFADGMFDDYLVQPLIEQHELLNRLNPAAVNTVRIDTFVDGEQVHTDGAVLRIGSGDKCVDNWSSGGFLAKIDLETGALSPTARTKAKYGRRVVREHPRTGFVFAGTIVPFWPELRALIVAAARAVRPLRYIGWDVAITPAGPLIIEGNHPSDTSLLQDGVGGLWNTPFGREVIRRLALGDTGAKGAPPATGPRGAH